MLQKKVKDISDEGLLLLEINPQLARKQWCYVTKLIEVTTEFISIWIDVLSRYILAYHSFDNMSNNYEISGLKYFITKSFGEKYEIYLQNKNFCC